MNNSSSLLCVGHGCTRRLKGGRMRLPLTSVTFTPAPTHHNQEMLSFKADINAVDVKRETPLSKAARAGMVDAVAALLTAGANIEVRDVEGRFAGESFSHKASRSEEWGILHIQRRLHRIRALWVALALLMALRVSTNE